MARRKRNSPVLEKADERVSGLRSISPTLDLGPGLTLAELEAKIAEFRTKQTNYNNLLPSLDALSNELDADEKALEELLSRFLLAAGAQTNASAAAAKISRPPTTNNSPPICLKTMGDEAQNLSAFIVHSLSCFNYCAA